MDKCERLFLGPSAPILTSITPDTDVLSLVLECLSYCYIYASDYQFNILKTGLNDFGHYTTTPELRQYLDCSIVRSKYLKIYQNEKGFNFSFLDSFQLQAEDLELEVEMLSQLIAVLGHNKFYIHDEVFFTDDYLKSFFITVNDLLSFDLAASFDLDKAIKTKTRTRECFAVRGKGINFLYKKRLYFKLRDALQIQLCKKPIAFASLSVGITSLNIFILIASLLSNWRKKNEN